MLLFLVYFTSQSGTDHVLAFTKDKEIPLAEMVGFLWPVLSPQPWRPVGWLGDLQPRSVPWGAEEGWAPATCCCDPGGEACGHSLCGWSACEMSSSLWPGRALWSQGKGRS